MKSIFSLALLATASHAAPQNLIGNLLNDISHFWPYFPKFFPTPDNVPAPIPRRFAESEAVVPQVKSATPVGLVNDPQLNRDSCQAIAFGDRALWTCRDTEYYAADGSIEPGIFISTTASWSDYNGGGPALQSLSSDQNPYNTTGLPVYGNNSITQAYFPIDPSKFCSTPSGACSDGTRYALWQDTAPMKTSPNTAYTWIIQAHITPYLQVVEANPPTTLYRIDYDGSSSDSLPAATALDTNFWGKDEIPFGAYGNVVRDGIAYLYGQANGTTALAKVPVDLVESKAAYLYWVNGTWTPTMPSINQDGIRLENANGGGQGTYYFSEPWNSYVWIGGSQFPGSDMYITTAPDPAGPWIEPFQFHSGVNGNYSLSAYSIQANPALITDESANEVYVSYTKVDVNSKGQGLYSTPLTLIKWE